MAHRFAIACRKAALDLARWILRLRPSVRWIGGLLALSATWVVVGALSDKAPEDALLKHAKAVYSLYQTTFMPYDDLHSGEFGSELIREMNSVIRARPESERVRKFTLPKKDKLEHFRKNFLDLKQAIEIQADKRSSPDQPASEQQWDGLGESIRLYQEMVGGLYLDFVIRAHERAPNPDGLGSTVTPHWLFTGYELLVPQAIAEILRYTPKYKQAYNLRSFRDETGGYSKVQIYLSPLEMRQIELVYLQSPKNDVEYARLLTAFVLNESMTNRWALRSLDTLQGAYPSIPVQSCGRDLVSFQLGDTYPKRKVEAKWDPQTLRLGVNSGLGKPIAWPKALGDDLIYQNLVASTRREDLLAAKDWILPMLYERPLLPNDAYLRLLRKSIALHPYCATLYAKELKNPQDPTLAELALSTRSDEGVGYQSEIVQRKTGSGAVEEVPSAAYVNLVGMNQPADIMQVDAIADRMTWKAFEDRKTFLTAHLQSFVEACATRAKEKGLHQVSVPQEEVVVLGDDFKPFDDDEDLESEEESQNEEPSASRLKAAMVKMFTPSLDSENDDRPQAPQAKLVLPPRRVARSKPIQLTSASKAKINAYVASELAAVEKSWKAAQKSELQKKIAIIDQPAFIRKRNQVRFDRKVSEMEPALAQGAMSQQVIDHYRGLSRTNDASLLKTLNRMSLPFGEGPLAGAQMNGEDRQFKNTSAFEVGMNLLVPETPDQLSMFFARKLEVYSEFGKTDAHARIAKEIMENELVMKSMSRLFSAVGEKFLQMNGRETKWVIMNPECSFNRLGYWPSGCEGRPFASLGTVIQGVIQDEVKKFEKELLERSTPPVLGSAPPQAEDLLPESPPVPVILQTSKRPKEFDPPKDAKKPPFRKVEEILEKGFGFAPQRIAVKGNATPVDNVATRVTGPRTVAKKFYKEPQKVRELFAEALAVVNLSHFYKPKASTKGGIIMATHRAQTFRETESYLRERTKQARIWNGMQLASQVARARSAGVQPPKAKSARTAQAAKSTKTPVAAKKSVPKPSPQPGLLERTATEFKAALRGISDRLTPAEVKRALAVPLDENLVLSMTDQKILAEVMRDGAYTDQPLLAFEPKNDASKKKSPTLLDTLKDQFAWNRATWVPGAGIVTWKAGKWQDMAQVKTRIQSMIQTAIRNDIGKVEHYCEASYGDPDGNFRSIYEVSSKYRSVLTNQNEALTRLDAQLHKKTRTRLEKLDRVLTPIAMAGIAVILGIGLFYGAGAIMMAVSSLTGWGVAAGGAAGASSGVGSVLMASAARWLGAVLWQNLIGNFGVVALAGTFQTGIMAGMYFYERPAQVRFMYESWNSDMGVTGQALSERKAVSEAQKELRFMKHMTVFSFVAEAVVFKYFTLPGIYRTFGVTGMKKAQALTNFPGGENLPRFTRKTLSELQKEHGRLKGLQIFVEKHILTSDFAKYRISALERGAETKENLLFALKKRLAYELPHDDLLRSPILGQLNKTQSKIDALNAEIRALEEVIGGKPAGYVVADQLRNFIAKFRIKALHANRLLVIEEGALRGKMLESSDELRHFFMKRKVQMLEYSKAHLASMQMKLSASRNTEQFFDALTEPELVQYMGFVKKAYQQSKHPQWLRARKVFKDYRFLEEEWKRFPSLAQTGLILARAQAQAQQNNAVSVIIKRDDVVTNADQIRSNLDADVEANENIIVITEEDLGAGGASQR